MYPEFGLKHTSRTNCHWLRCSISHASYDNERYLLSTYLVFWNAEADVSNAYEVKLRGWEWKSIQPIRDAISARPHFMRDEDEHIAMSPLDTVGEVPILLQVLEIGLYPCDVKPHNGAGLRTRVSVTGCQWCVCVWSLTVHCFAASSAQ